MTALVMSLLLSGGPVPGREPARIPWGPDCYLRVLGADGGTLAAEVVGCSGTRIADAGVMLFRVVSP